MAANRFQRLYEFYKIRIYHVQLVNQHISAPAHDIIISHYSTLLLFRRSALAVLSSYIHTFGQNTSVKRVISSSKHRSQHIMVYFNSPPRVSSTPSSAIYPPTIWTILKVYFKSLKPFPSLHSPQHPSLRQQLSALSL
jgi:hypothetical protein